jgi:hypothetical protein
VKGIQLKSNHFTLEIFDFHGTREPDGTTCVVDLSDLTKSKRGTMKAGRQDQPTDAIGDRRSSFRKAEEKAREVLKERGLSPEQIEAQLNRPRRQSPYDG